MASKVHVIYNDHHRHYFKLLSLGMFWECVNDVKEARKFTSRSAAAAMMKKCGKHREGWRVITVGVQ